MTPALAFLLAVATQPTPLSPQDPVAGALPAPARPIARYIDGDHTRAVTRGEVALEMAFHQRHKDAGREAVGHLITTTMVRQQADALGLWPSDRDVQALWAELERQLRAQGRDPMDVPVIKNSGLDGFLADLALQLAHEQLVRKQLELGKDEPVGADMLQLWVVEARKRTPIVEDPDQLPAGTAARVGGVDIPLIDLGMLLLRLSETEEQDRFIRQVVVLQRIEAMAREQGLAVTQEDVDLEIHARKAAAERDPRYQGMSFEQLLSAQGLTVDWLRESRVFRGQLLQKKLAARQLPRQDLLAEIARDRQAVLDRAGPRRRLGLIFVRALDEPNELVRRDFTAAMAHLRTVRQRLETEAFETVARIESESASGKMRGGDVGWFQRTDDQLPAPVMAAAFALAADEVSDPVRAEDGCYLVKLLGVEPAPTDDELVTRLREQRIEALTKDLLESAHIVRPDGTPLDDEGGR